MRPRHLPWQTRRSFHFAVEDGFVEGAKVEPGFCWAALFALGDDTETFGGVGVSEPFRIGRHFVDEVDDPFVAGHDVASLQEEVAVDGRCFEGIVGVGEDVLVAGDDVDARLAVEVAP